MQFETFQRECSKCLELKDNPFTIFVYPNEISVNLCMKCYAELMQIVRSRLLDSKETTKRVAKFFEFIK